MTKPINIMPTRSQVRVCKANINGVPIPPAPIKPSIEADLKFNSKRYNTNDMYEGSICGTTANISVLIELAPLATSDSVGLKSRFSRSSANNLPIIPIE